MLCEVLNVIDVEFEVLEKCFVEFLSESESESVLLLLLLKEKK